jgi:protein involved in polysaccharide export with SLBB domain
MMPHRGLFVLLFLFAGSTEVLRAQGTSSGPPREIRVGDRIIIEAVNPQMPAALNDTFVVREGRTLLLPGVRQGISLQGTSTANLTETITAGMLTGGIQNPLIRSTLMLGVFITGQVSQPGATWVTPDAILRDAVTAAGTVTASANIDKIVVKRDGQVIHDRDATRRPLTEGRTFADLNIVTGDEIEVGEKRRLTWFSVLSVATTLVSLAFSIATLTRDR